MPKNQRLTLLVALVFGGLLVFSLLINLARQRQFATLPTLTPASGQLFPEVQPAAITRIVVKDKQTGARLTLVRVPGDWHATNANGQPVSVDLGQVTRMIQILGTLRYNRVLQESNVETYGLAGDGQVNIAFDAGVTHVLRVGNQAQVSGSTYLQRDADPAIYLAPSELVATLSSILATPAP